MSTHLPRLILWSLAVWGMSAMAAADLSLQERTLSADITEHDLREDVHVLRGNVRISQGAMSIEAEQATASSLQSRNSRWTFERAVHIQTEDADLKSNSASAAFSEGALSTARILGTPALFEHRRVSDKEVRGRAEVIEYDLAAGTVTLTGQVRFIYGDNEVLGDTVVYDLRQERIVARGEKGGRVNMTIRPQPRGGTGADKPGAAPAADGDESGE